LGDLRHAQPADQIGEGDSVGVGEALERDALGSGETDGDKNIRDVTRVAASATNARGSCHYLRIIRITKITKRLSLP